MADTLTIRLDPALRRQFDAEALSRGVGPSTLARELLSERLREIRRARIYRESEEAGKRYHAALAARDRGAPHEGIEIWELESGATDLPPCEGTVGGNTTIKAGQILWIDWRGGALPKGANKLRPGIVVEGSDYFAPQYPSVLVVPCTTFLPTAAPSLCVEIQPDETNGFVRPTWAIAPGATSTSKRRIVRETTHFVTPAQLAEIRSQLAEVLEIS